jgi:hypothetical protein
MDFVVLLLLILALVGIVGAALYVIGASASKR